MHEDPVPACVRAGSAAGPPASTALGPCLTTSIYETTLGLAAFTWYRTVLGLRLRVELALPATGPAAAAYWLSSSSAASNDVASVSSTFSSASASSDGPFASYRFRVRPWLLWKRRGTRRFQVRDPGGVATRTFDFAWDVSRAAFPRGGGPEPKSGFFVSVTVDGQLFLVVGDALDEAYKKTKMKKPSSGCFGAAAPTGSPTNPILASRREHVVLQESSAPYATKASMGGKEREISIHLVGGGGGGGAEKDAARFSLELDGKRVLQVKRLRWKFRGNERVPVDNGDGIQVSWDVYNWLFPNRAENRIAVSAAPAAANPDLGYAVFVLRFDKEDGKQPEEKSLKGSSTAGSGSGSGGSGSGCGSSRRLWGMYGMGNSEIGDLSGSSSSFLGIGFGGGKRKGRRSLLKTKSSSSSSSASSASSSTVMEWTSAEETELNETDGFSLLVYVWRR